MYERMNMNEHGEQKKMKMKIVGIPSDANR